MGLLNSQIWILQSLFGGNPLSWIINKYLAQKADQLRIHIGIVLAQMFLQRHSLNLGKLELEFIGLHPRDIIAGWRPNYLDNPEQLVS
jgi:hypothetical protein